MWCNFIHSEVSLELLTQGSNTSANQPTGHNVLKPCEVRGTVQSQAMGCNVSSTADSCKTNKRSEQTVLRAGEIVQWIGYLPYMWLTQV